MSSSEEDTKTKECTKNVDSNGDDCVNSEHNDAKNKCKALKANVDINDRKNVTANASVVKSSDAESKLKHLTAERVKGPANRRLPTLKKTAQDECSNEEKHENRNGVKYDELNLCQSKSKQKDTTPVMSELQTKLRKRNDDKRASLCDTSYVRRREQTTSRGSDTKSTPETALKPNLDTINKRHSFNPLMSAELQNKVMSNSLLKTPKANSLSKSVTMANVSQSSADSSVLFKVKQLQASLDDCKEAITELRKKLNELRDNYVSRKDYDELKAMVLELKKQVTTESK